MSDRAPTTDWDKVEDMTLALMHLTSFEEHGIVRSWKGHAWEVLNRLHERGWISNPVSQAKSVTLSDEAARRSRELFEQRFGQPDPASRRSGVASGLWARTRLHVWPETYRLVSLPASSLPEAAAILAGGAGAFAALVLERDEVSLTLPETLWRARALRSAARADDGPYRAITLDLDVDLSVTGYLAPAAARLAEAGVSIVPQCGSLKDHLLVREAQLARAVEVLEGLIADARA